MSNSRALFYLYLQYTFRITLTGTVEFSGSLEGLQELMDCQVKASSDYILYVDIKKTNIMIIIYPLFEIVTNYP